jgi:hypothetical protein
VMRTPLFGMKWDKADRTPWLRILLRAALALALFMAGAPGICSAKEMCQWLNEATAVGALDGQVSSTVKLTGKTNDDANCEFVRRQGSVVVSLDIEVETSTAPSETFATYKARCATDSAPLRAIGNEATICSAPRKKRVVSEQVVGRVRDRVFLVRITSNKKSADQAVIREKTRKIAEQVAGYLF